MTTIAYKHDTKTIAWDSRATSGNVIASDADQKMTEVNGVKFWLSGAVADERLLIDMYFGEKSEVIPEANALAWDGDELFLVGVNDEALLWKQPLRHDKVLGSGGNFAISAMRLGLGAKEAVEHAKTLDCYTGGEVHVMELE